MPVPATRAQIDSRSRNAFCGCNSGLRYKHCCGSTSADTASISARYERRRIAGLALHRHGEFSAALDIYDALLREQGEDWDVAHMRATCMYQLGSMDDACIAFAELFGTPAEELPGFWTNLGLLVASICADPWSPSSLQAKLDGW